jgi:hypothetical protein
MDSNLVAAITYRYPFNVNYKRQRFQSIYLQSVFGSLSFLVTINKLSLKSAGTCTSSYDRITSYDRTNFRIGYDTTTASSYSYSSTFKTTNAAVYGPATVSSTTAASGNWVQFDLATPIVWDGTMQPRAGLLVIQVRLHKMWRDLHEWIDSFSIVRRIR